MLEATGRSQNKFNETGPAKQEYQGNEMFCEQNGYNGLYGKEQTNRSILDLKGQDYY